MLGRSLLYSPEPFCCRVLHLLDVGELSIGRAIRAAPFCCSVRITATLHSIYIPARLSQRPAMATLARAVIPGLLTPASRGGRRLGHVLMPNHIRIHGQAQSLMFNFWLVTTPRQGGERGK